MSPQLLCGDPRGERGPVKVEGNAVPWLQQALNKLLHSSTE